MRAIIDNFLTGQKIDVTELVLDCIGAETLTAENWNAASCAAEDIAIERGPDWSFYVGE